MGVFDFIFDNSELRCASAIAFAPILSGPACEETVEKVVQNTAKAAENYGEVLDTLLFPFPDFYRLEIFPGQIPRRLVEATPMRVFQRNPSSQLLNRLHSLNPEVAERFEKLLLGAILPAIFPGPFLPIALGLEHYGLTPNVGVEKFGKFAAELAVSAATLGAGRAVGKGVKKAIENAATPEAARK